MVHFHLLPHRTIFETRTTTLQQYRTVYETDIYSRRLSDHARFVKLAQCMLRSLQYMHSKGIVHRDVKVGNSVCALVCEPVCTMSCI